MIYLDSNATTRVAPEVFEAMKPFLLEFYGNASSSYSFARQSKDALEKSREQIAALLGANNTNEIVFTSCGTEADNWAIYGALEANPQKKHIVTTRVEHEAIRKLCQKLAENYIEISFLDVNNEGLLDLEQLRQVLRTETAIVSVMLANNETGVLFPVEEIAKIVKEHSDALFHVDGVQAVGKIPINLRNTEIDLFSVSGHKFHAPKGVGTLYIKEGLNLPSFFIGGGQEQKRRAGTEAVAQIVGLGAAAELARSFDGHAKIRALRDKLEDGILSKIPNSQLNGTKNRDWRLPNTTNISFTGIEGESILAHLDKHEICVSTGSACNSETHEASPVLQAMNVPYTQAMGAVRFSLGRYNTEEETDFLLTILPDIISQLAKMSPYLS
jgi:cysteine desulfurase